MSEPEPLTASVLLRSCIALLALVLTVPVIAGGPAEGPGAARHDTKRTSGQVDGVSVLVQLVEGSGVEAVAARTQVRSFATFAGGFVRYEYDILPGVLNLRDIPEARLQELERIPGVVRVDRDRRFRANLRESTPLVQALPSQIVGAGVPLVDGSGVRVCVVDTGIDSDHVMYSGRIDGAAGYDFVNNDADPEDDGGHGSHVAGIAVGGGGIERIGCTGSEPFQGIAPAATLIGVKVLGATGYGYESDVIQGIDHCASPDLPGGQADVINLSLGHLPSGTCDEDLVAAAANNAVADGVVVVAAAGNGGQTDRLASPACGSQVISVGATYDDDFPNCDDPTTRRFTFCTQLFFGCIEECTDEDPPVDSLLCSSNQSVELDVTAPGCKTVSADDAPGGGEFIDLCGTSMASPHVAGLAALLLDADPTLTPAAVRQAIRDGAVDLGPPGSDRGYGHGRVDAAASLQLIAPPCSEDSECDDGQFCNGRETCVAGACQLADATACDDAVDCTYDVCDEVTDSCINWPYDPDCDDGQFCNGVEVCQASGCAPGAPACVPGEFCDEAGDSCQLCPSEERISPIADFGPVDGADIALRDPALAYDDDGGTSAVGIFTPSLNIVSHQFTFPSLFAIGGVQIDMGVNAGRLTSSTISALYSTDDGDTWVEFARRDTDGREVYASHHLGLVDLGQFHVKVTVEGNRRSGSGEVHEIDFVASPPSYCPCWSDADCDDGVFCNGSEVCIEQACEPATAPACEPTETCMEDTGSCVPPCPPTRDCVGDNCQPAIPGDCNSQDTGMAECVADNGVHYECPAGETIWIENCTCEAILPGSFCANTDQSWACR